MAAPPEELDAVSQRCTVIAKRITAAVIVLLYAQPLTRVVQLTLDHVLRDGGNVLLQLGEPPSPVPGRLVSAATPQN